MVRLSRLFSRKDAGAPASDQHIKPTQKRVTEVTAAPPSAPLPPPAQSAGSSFPAATPRHVSVADDTREDVAAPETDAAAQQDGAPARRHHVADLRTPAQADPLVRVRITPVLAVSVAGGASNWHVYTHVSAARKRPFFLTRQPWIVVSDELHIAQYCSSCPAVVASRQGGQWCLECSGTRSTAHTRCMSQHVSVLRAELYGTPFAIVCCLAVRMNGT